MEAHELQQEEIKTSDSGVTVDQNQRLHSVQPNHRNYSHVIMRTLKALNVMMHFALFYIYWACIYGNADTVKGIYQNTVVSVGYLVLLVMFDRIYNAFDVGLSRISELVYANELSSILAGIAMYVLNMLIWCRIPAVLPILALLIVQAGWNVLWAYVANHVFFTVNKHKRTVIVYRNESDLKKLSILEKYKRRFAVEKYVENPRGIKELIKEIEGYDVVFAVGIGATLRNGLAKYCVEHNVYGYIEPKVGDIILSGAREMQSFSIPICCVRQAAPHVEYLIVKRIMDIVFSLALILITWPVMLITAIAIRLYDNGPVLYKQVRLTKDAREFEILKFRSMRVDAEADGVVRLSSGDKDSRVTPVGKVIRFCRIDELPQLFNILRGDMTIVGPRPERPELIREYEKTVPAFRLRLQVKAGLTGYAQVYGRYNTQPYDKLQMDLMYINKMSVAEDLRLMIATVKILFIRESTEGIEE